MLHVRITLKEIFSRDFLSPSEELIHSASGCIEISKRDEPIVDFIRPVIGRDFPKPVIEFMYPFLGSRQIRDDSSRVTITSSYERAYRASVFYLSDIEVLSGFDEW